MGPDGAGRNPVAPRQLENQLAGGEHLLRRRPVPASRAARSEVPFETDVDGFRVGQKRRGMDSAVPGDPEIEAFAVDGRAGGVMDDKPLIRQIGAPFPHAAIAYEPESAGVPGACKAGGIT